MRKTNVIGIMGAMPEEIKGITQLLDDVSIETFGQREYHSGFCKGQKFVVVFSRWGKVAAATTVTTLIHEFGVTEILFTGVAGAIHPALKVGDVVLGKRFIQHDLDGRPLMKKFEIPLLNQTYLVANEAKLESAQHAVSRVLEDKILHDLISDSDLQSFEIVQPKMFLGDIGSGDQFISTDEARNNITRELPGVLCVEMEGASVAQVCFEYEIPLTVIRTISDEANASSVVDFPAFIKSISSVYSVAFVRELYQLK